MKKFVTIHAMPLYRNCSLPVGKLKSLALGSIPAPTKFYTLLQAAPLSHVLEYTLSPHFACALSKT